MDLNTKESINKKYSDKKKSLKEIDSVKNSENNENGSTKSSNPSR